MSNSISKLGAAIPSVNLPPGTTCDPSAGCYLKCYARKGRFAFPHVKELLQRNFDIWKEDPEGFERDVKIAAYTSRFFRFHSSGDIPDPAYLAMMVRVARHCPNTSFLCFTKKFDIVNRFLDENWQTFPDNLHIVFSAWGDRFPNNPYNLPIAYIKFKKEASYIPESAAPCSGYCGEVAACL